MTPDEHTNQELFLDVGDGHQLYVQDWGKQDAKTPILFLHGGPGTGVNDQYKTTFNPTVQRVIFFDQRGSGKSTPSGSIKHNTTRDLIEDIEKIADKLKLKQFHITGGSWGACLALAYALEHPQRVKSLVLRGIFTGSKAEIEWLTKGRFRDFFPDVWEQYVASVPASHAEDPSGYHVPRIIGSNELESIESAYVVSNVEGALLSLDDRYTPPDMADYDPTLSTIETHYMANNCFLPDRYILEQASQLTMPTWLIQGRYDMVCPPTTAYELSKQLPQCQLIWTIAGHGNDRGNYDVNRTILLQMAGD